MTFLYYTFIFLFLLTCVVLCFVILIQESKSTGLGASFGGDASDSVFGTSTASVLKKFTGYLAAVFFVSCVILSLWTGAMARTSHQNSEEYPVIEAETQP